MFNSGRYTIDKTLQNLIEQIDRNNDSNKSAETVAETSKRAIVQENLNLLDGKLRQLQEADDDVDFAELPITQRNKESAVDKAALITKLSKLTKQELNSLQQKERELLYNQQKLQTFTNAAADSYDLIKYDFFAYETPVPLYNSELGDGFLCNYSHIEDSYTDINLVPNERHIQRVNDLNIVGADLSLIDIYSRIKSLQLAEIVKGELSNEEKLEFNRLQSKFANYIATLQYLLASFLTVYGLNDRYTVIAEARTSRRVYQLIFNHRKKVDSLTAELLVEKLSAYLTNIVGLQIPTSWTSNNFLQFMLDVLAGKLALVIYLSKAFTVIKLAQLLYTNKSIQNKYAKIAKRVVDKISYEQQLPQVRAAYNQLKQFLKLVIAKIDESKIKQPNDETVRYFLYDLLAFLGYPIIIANSKIYSAEKTVSYKIFNELQVYGDHLSTQQKSNKAIRKFWFNTLRLAEVGDTISWFILLEENSLDTLELFAEIFGASFKFDL